MGEIKDLLKSIEKEVGVKERSDDKMKKIKKDLIRIASGTLRDERILAGGAFTFAKWHKEFRFSAWSNDFDSMTEIIEAYQAVRGYQIPLVPREFEAVYNVRGEIKIVPDSSGSLELVIGEEVMLDYLKAVVKDYGLRVDVRGIATHLKKDEYSHRKWFAAREKLMLAGAAEGLPMCDIVGFAEEYLDIEEQYGRMLHSAFKTAAAFLEIKEHRELQQDFDLLDLQSGIPLFLAMGRAVFKEMRDQNDGTG